MEERWAIIGENPRYEVSTLGRVRHGSRILNPAARSTDGYVSVQLSLGARHHNVSRLVHVLVANAFIPNPNHLPLVNHKNWKRADNKVDNLEWVTIKQNRNKWIPGATPGRRGRKVVQLTLTGQQIQIWDSVTDAVRAISGIWQQTVIKCCKGNASQAAGFRWAYLDEMEVIAGEIWKSLEVKGKQWMVSSVGRVRTHTGYTTYGAKGGPYLTINGLCVHKLIAEAFCHKPDYPNLVVNHKNGNKQINTVSNLEWCTQAENVQHAVSNGLIPKTYNTKLKHAVIQILSDSKSHSYASIADASRKTGIAQNSISKVCRGKSLLAGGYKWIYATPTIDSLDAPNIPVISDEDSFWAELGIYEDDSAALMAGGLSDEDPLWGELSM